MDPLIGASLITAGSNFLGSRMDDRSAQGMSDDDRRFQYKMWKRNRDEQRIFAQNTLQWRTDDARRAGLHPLAAMGLSSSSFSPVMGGGSGGVMSSRGDAVRAAGAQIAQMVADQKESESRTKLNTAQANLLEQQARDSAVARVNQLPVKDIFDPKFVRQQMTPGVSVGGIDVRTSPFSADAQTYEDRYGELGGSLMGLMNIPFDVAHSIESYIRSGGLKKDISDLFYRSTK